MSASIKLPARSSVELKLSVELPGDDEVIMTSSDELISELEDCSVLLGVDSVESIELKDVDSRSSLTVLLKDVESRSSLTVLTLSDDSELSVEATDDDSTLEEGTSDVTASELLECEDSVDILSEEGVENSEVDLVGFDDSDSNVVSDVSELLDDVSVRSGDDSDIETADTLDISDDELSSLAAVVDS